MLSARRVAPLLILLSMMALNIAHAQATLDVVLFRSADSLTIYLPGTTLINISGLRVDATTATGENLSQVIETLPAFRGLPFSGLPTPLCFHMTRTTNAPLPLSCQAIPTFTQPMVDADVFWYDLTARVDRSLIVYLGSSVQLCPAGSARCSLAFAVPPTPTASPTSTVTHTPIFTPTPSQTPTPTVTPTVEIPLGFSPVTSNDEWEVVTQDFDGVMMVLVPPGCFMMGTTDEQARYAIDELGAQPEWIGDEQPAHEQCFDEPFWIDQTEVTQANFDAVGMGKENANEFEGDDRPVDSITWFEARDYCEVIGLHLPTEREWEYAARGPDNLIFPWGNEWDEDLTVWNTGQTENVGSIPEGQSWVGALDMSSNVYEWVNTIYGVDTDFDFNFNESGERLYPYPYAQDEREQDSENGTYSRVLRGGSWLSGYSTGLRTTNRDKSLPANRFNEVGFRCAMDYTPPE